MSDKIGTLTVYSTRGGNGKTITSILLAIAAAKKKLKTVLIDADIEAPSLMHLLKPTNEGPTWVDYLDENSDDLSSIPRKTTIPYLDVIYSPPPKVGKNFLGWKTKEWWQLALKRSMIAESELHRLGYDLIVIDNQSGTSLNSVNNMVLADTSVMVIRPATYGVGAAENFIGEMYRVLRDLKPRKDYYMWNQVYIPKEESDKKILYDFLGKWDEIMKDHGILYGGKIDFSTKLNLGLLGDNPNLLDFYEEVKEPIDALLDLVLFSKEKEL